MIGREFVVPFDVCREWFVLVFREERSFVLELEVHGVLDGAAFVVAPLA